MSNTRCVGPTYSPVGGHFTLGAQPVLAPLVPATFHGFCPLDEYLPLEAASARATKMRSVSAVALLILAYVSHGECQCHDTPPSQNFPRGSPFCRPGPGLTHPDTSALLTCRQRIRGCDRSVSIGAPRAAAGSTDAAGFPTHAYFPTHAQHPSLRSLRTDPRRGCGLGWLLGAGRTGPRQWLQADATWHERSGPARLPQAPTGLPWAWALILLGPGQQHPAAGLVPSAPGGDS